MDGVTKRQNFAYMMYLSVTETGNGCWGNDSDLDIFIGVVDQEVDGSLVGQKFKKYVGDIKLV